MLLYRFLWGGRVSDELALIFAEVLSSQGTFPVDEEEMHTGLAKVKSTLHVRWEKAYCLLSI